MRVVLCTCAPGKGAELLRQLLSERLVACGNILPGVRSLYRWKGAIEDEPEELLVMETQEQHVSSLIDRIQDIHEYEVPKIIALDVQEVAEAYLQWVREMTTPE